MTVSEIPERIRKFFESNIDSVELLHVLMLLHDQPSREWSLAGISAELRSSETSVAKRIRTLIDRKVLAPEAEKAGVVVYRVVDADTGSLLGEALEFYRLRPYRVVELIFSKRVDPIRSIADAFRFRKEEE